MNNILHNISVLLLGAGIILLTIYITKSYNIQKNTINEDQVFIRDIYKERPSRIFRNMFDDPSLYIQKYADIDFNTNQEKLYL
jgi:hypothetical protein